MNFLCDVTYLSCDSLHLSCDFSHLSGDFSFLNGQITNILKFVKGHVHIHKIVNQVQNMYVKKFKD